MLVFDVSTFLAFFYIAEIPKRNDPRRAWGSDSRWTKNNVSGTKRKIVARFSNPGAWRWSLGGRSGWDQMDVRATRAVADVLGVLDC